MAPGNLLDFFLSLILLPMTVLKLLVRALDVGVSVKMITGLRSANYGFYFSHFPVFALQLAAID